MHIKFFNLLQRSLMATAVFPAQRGSDDPQLPSRFSPVQLAQLLMTQFNEPNLPEPQFFQAISTALSIDQSHITADSLIEDLMGERWQASLELNVFRSMEG